MNILILAPILSIAILFVILATSLWRRSISTTIHAISVAGAIYCYPICNTSIVLTVLFVGVTLNMIRAVVNTEQDRFIKRNSLDIV